MYMKEGGMISYNKCNRNCTEIHIYIEYYYRQKTEVRYIFMVNEKVTLSYISYYSGNGIAQSDIENNYNYVLTLLSLLQLALGVVYTFS